MLLLLFLAKFIGCIFLGYLSVAVWLIGDKTDLKEVFVGLFYFISILLGALGLYLFTSIIYKSL